MCIKNKLTDIHAIASFMMAGNATFTLVSTKTENRFTFKVTSVPNSDDRFFVKVLSGPDNQSDYMYIGIMFDNEDHLYFAPREPFATGVEVMKWFTNNLHKVDELPPQIEFWHEGKCGMCGKKLTTPESIERGFGPTCFANRGGR